jgi:adenosine 3'-phospho 5'-phosphosulfate transporter B3
MRIFLTNMKDLNFLLISKNLLENIALIGKKYNLLDKLSVIFMTIGLIFFTLADSKFYPNFESYGVFLVMLALVADAVIGNVWINLID